MSISMVTWNQKDGKNKIMLHGYGQLYTLRKKRKHLRRHCKRYWNKIDNSNYELERPSPKKIKKLLD